VPIHPSITVTVMGLFNRTPKEPKLSRQDQAMAALTANTVKLKGLALSNESFSIAGSYDGKPKKEQQEEMTRFLAAKKAKAVYPETAWSGAVFLTPEGSNVLIVADGYTIDQLTKDGAKAFLEISTAPVPAWCEIQLIGKAPYTRMHVKLSAKQPKPKA
jgi:hypothetical protein